jgi:hypothetical protein
MLEELQEILGEGVEVPVGRTRRKTHCKRGHELTPENVRLNSKGSRSCRACERIHARKWATANKDKARELGRAWATANREKIRQRRRKAGGFAERAILAERAKLVAFASRWMGDIEFAQFKHAVEAEEHLKGTVIKKDQE